MMDDAQFYDYVERKRRGEDFSSIRQSMQEEGVPQDQIDRLIREIDEEIQLSVPSKTRSLTPRMIAGTILCLTGLLLAAFGVFGMLNLVLILSGLAMMVARRKPLESRMEQKKWRRS